MTSFKIFSFFAISLTIFGLLSAFLSVGTSPVLAQSGSNSESAGSNSTLTTPSKAGKPEDLCGTFGDGSCLKGTGDYATGDTKDSVTSLTISVVNFLIYLGAAVAVLFIVLGGYTYITANGDDSKVKSGKSMVINALIGLVILIISFTLVTMVANFTSTVDLNSK